MTFLNLPLAAAVIGALTLAPRVAIGAELPLTLDAAIRMALQRNEALIVARESLTAAAADLSGARGAYDPVLGVDGAWSRSTEPTNSSFSGAPAGHLAPEIESTSAGATLQQRLPSGGALSLRTRGGRQTTDGMFALLSPAFTSSVGAELRQPLLRDLGIDPARLSVRVARAGREYAAASLHRTVSETVASVEKAYWDLAAAREALSVRDDAVRLATQQLDETRTRVQSGSAPGTELSQPRAELERRRGELFADRAALARAENALKLLILGDGEADLWSAALAPSDTTAIDGNPADPPALLERAFDSRPELEAARATVERRRAESAFARNGVWPALDAVVSYDRFGLAGTRNPVGPSGAVPPGMEGDLGNAFHTLGQGGFDATRVALVLALPIRNRTARAEAIVARSIVRQSEAEVTRVRKTVRVEVLDAVAAVETAGQRIQAARAAREAADVQLAAERDRYATGLSTNFLVLTRQNDLSRARLDEIAARTDYQTAHTELARATGTLIASHHIDVAGTPR